MIEGHVSPAILKKNREVIFQFEPNKKDQFQFSYKKSPVSKTFHAIFCIFTEIPRKLY